MYGALFDSQSERHSLLSTTHKPPPSESNRRSFSRQELLNLRESLDETSSISEEQKLKLGPIFCSKTGHRWTSRVSSGALHFDRETKDPKPFSSPLASSSSTTGERFIRRGTNLYGNGVPSHFGGSPPAEESPMMLFEKDSLGRPFRNTANGSPPLRRSPSPPSKRFEISNRLSVKVDATQVASIGSTEGKLWGGLSSPRQEEKSSGKIDNARRLPSPLGSPRSYVSAAQKGNQNQTFYPPGFGPQHAQKNAVSRAARASANAARDAYYKSRICRGPNMSENFASRIAYKQRTSNAGSHVNTQSQQNDRLLTNDGIASVNMGPALPSSLSENHTHVAPGIENNADMRKLDRPTLDYTIAPDISFEDFSRRLAQEASTIPFNDDKDHDVVLPNDNQVSTSEPLSEWLTERPHEKYGSVKEKFPEEDADELQKWFGRISVPTTVPASETTAPSPGEEVNLNKQASNKAEYKEQLDSKVLSFFDTIRSQALSNDLPENTNNGAEDYSEESARDSISPGCDGHDVSKGEQRRIPTVESDHLGNSEIERFFQLFTEGKPVYAMEDQTSAADERVAPLQTVEDSMSSRLNHKVEASDQESENVGLKLLWAELAAANQVE